MFILPPLCRSDHRWEINWRTRTTSDQSKIFSFFFFLFEWKIFLRNTDMMFWGWTGTQRMENLCW
jgi:hypothetical protein